MAKFAIGNGKSHSCLARAMNELYDKFLQYIRCELNLSAHTVLSYGSDLRQWHSFSVEAFGDRFDPVAADVSDLRLWIAHLASNGDSPRSVRRKVQTLRAFFNYLIRAGKTADNPAMELVPGRLPKALPKVVRPDDMKNLLDSNYDHADFVSVRNRLIICMLYSTGMRASELTSLKAVNVDLSRGELKVLGKRNKERMIPFGKELNDMIRLYLTMRPDSDSACFFVNEEGAGLTYPALNAIVKGELTGRVTAPRKTPHVLRHSFATDMLNGGAEITAVQQLLGHASLATTQIYTHLSYKDLQKNYELAHPRAKKS